VGSQKSRGGALHARYAVAVPLFFLLGHVGGGEFDGTHGFGWWWVVVVGVGWDEACVVCGVGWGGRGEGVREVVV